MAANYSVSKTVMDAFNKSLAESIEGGGPWSGLLFEKKSAGYTMTCECGHCADYKEKQKVCPSCGGNIFVTRAKRYESAHVNMHVLRSSKKEVLLFKKTFGFRNTQNGFEESTGEKLLYSYEPSGVMKIHERSFVDEKIFDKFLEECGLGEFSFIFSKSLLYYGNYTEKIFRGLTMSKKFIDVEDAKKYPNIYRDLFKLSCERGIPIKDVEDFVRVMFAEPDPWEPAINLIRKTGNSKLMQNYSSLCLMRDREDDFSYFSDLIIRGVLNENQLIEICFEYNKISKLGEITNYSISHDKMGVRNLGYNIKNKKVSIPGLDEIFIQFCKKTVHRRFNCVSEFCYRYGEFIQMGITPSIDAFTTSYYKIANYHNLGINDENFIDKIRKDPLGSLKELRK